MMLLCDTWFHVFVMIKIEIFGSYFWVVSSWYQSPGLRDSDTLPGACDQPSSSKYSQITHTSYLFNFSLVEQHARIGLRV